MEKNTIILDEMGNVVGHTYPKRARGLVKCGRAEYIDDCTIRLCHNSDATSMENQSEDIDMSERIVFNAREFKKDKAFEGNVASRMFVTDVLGETVEIFELGNVQGVASRIYGDKVLQEDTDYRFCFAMTRGYNDTDEGTSQFVIVPLDGDEMTEDDWEERYVFNLAQCSYKPTLSKKYAGALLKIYEIPFHAPKEQKYRLFFIEEGTVTKIYPAAELSAYENVSDFGYAAWLNDKKERINEKVKDLNVDQTLKDVSETVKSAMDKLMKTVFPGATGPVDTTATEITPDEEEAPVEGVPTEETPAEDATVADAPATEAPVTEAVTAEDADEESQEKEQEKVTSEGSATE